MNLKPRLRAKEDGKYLGQVEEPYLQARTKNNIKSVGL